MNILKKISNNLFEIHSQFSEQGLLDSNTHIDTLDEFGDYLDNKIKIEQIVGNLYWNQKNNLKIKGRITIVKNEREQIEYDLKEIENLNLLKMNSMN